MREKKFRAWDKDAECMAYSDNQDDYWWEINPLRCGYIAGESGGDQFEPPSPVPGYCDNVMEFTGLYDKDNKEDWIDDIVKIKIGGVEYYRKIYQTISGSFCINLPSIGSTDIEGAPITLLSIEHENVGNVHENSELLNNENKQYE